MLKAWVLGEGSRACGISQESWMCDIELRARHLLDFSGVDGKITLLIELCLLLSEDFSHLDLSFNCKFVVLFNILFVLGTLKQQKLPV